MGSVIAEDITKIKLNVTKLVFDENLKKQVKNGVILLNTVYNLLNKLQITQASTADAAEEWLTLCLADGFDQYDHFVKKR